MVFKNGQDVISQAFGTLSIQKKLGEGGQGVVYLVTARDNKSYAFKYYHADFSTREQFDALQELIRRGPPMKVSHRFVWPLDVIKVSSETSFGYLMPLIDTDRFAELGNIWSGAKSAPQYSTMCEITCQVAESYRALHTNGYCYRDINQGNVMFESTSGKVLICDNDNVGIDKHPSTSIQGTWEFMPPELILGVAAPSTATDRHMLSVWLFYLWMWHHPLHGRMEYNIRSWDLIAKRQIYGVDPVFIFHPQDHRNELPDEYTTPYKRWHALPPSLKQLFKRAFTEGLTEPNKRVTDGEWLASGQRLKDTTLCCHKCGAITLWEPNMKAPGCWNCTTPLALPPLAVFAANGDVKVTLTPGRRILHRHADRQAKEELAETVIGEVVQNPQRPDVWGIRNVSSYTWVAIMPSGERKDVPPQKSVPLNLGAKVQLPGSIMEIMAS